MQNRDTLIKPLDEFLQICYINKKHLVLFYGWLFFIVLFLVEQGRIIICLEILSLQFM